MKETKYMHIWSGIIDLPWWGYAIVALGLTHMTIAAVTIYLHRHQTHRALELHPVVAHFFRFWLWLTTGMVTREWVAAHRVHHQKVETIEDPHSPQAQMKVLNVNGFWGRLFFMFKFVLMGGVRSYVQWTNTHQDEIKKFGATAPQDWVERHIYSTHTKLGVTLMGVIDVVLFGPLAGSLVWGIQMLWIPIFAAGIVNGVGHIWGYRNYKTADRSHNVIPWGILIGGEELHNNHHAFASSAKLKQKWYEFDIGWVYIKLLRIFRLASHVKEA